MYCKPNISKGPRKSSQLFCQLPFPNLNALPLLINLFLFSLPFCDICTHPNVLVDFVLSFSLRFSAPTNPIHVVGTHTQLSCIYPATCAIFHSECFQIPQPFLVFGYHQSNLHAIQNCFYYPKFN